MRLRFLPSILRSVYMIILQICPPSLQHTYGSCPSPAFRTWALKSQELKKLGRGAQMMVWGVSQGSAHFSNTVGQSRAGSEPMTLKDSHSSIIDQNAQRARLSFLNKERKQHLCRGKPPADWCRCRCRNFPLIMRQESGEGKHQHSPERRSTAPQVSLQGIISGGWTQ